jgi:hypothetical protein
MEASSMFRRIALLGSLIATVFALAVPGTALGATSVEVALVGTFTDPSGIVGGAGGVVSIQGFADDRGVVAEGVATYSLCIPNVDPKNCLATLTQAVTIPVSSLSATCAQATIDLAALTIVSPPSLDGFTLNFDPIEVVFTADTATTQRSACAIARRLDHGAHDASLARLLNRLLAGL